MENFKDENFKYYKSFLLLINDLPHLKNHYLQNWRKKNKQ